MSCIAKKTIGTSDCKSSLEYLKGIIITPSDYTITATDAEDSSFWQAAIADGTITLFPKWGDYENISTDPVLEETPMTTTEVHPGNYRMKFMFKTDIKQHQGIYSWNGSGGRVFLIDRKNAIWGTSQDDGATMKGILLDQLHIEKLRLNDGSLSTKSIVNTYFIDNTEIDLRGYGVDASGFVNSLVPLSAATIEISGVPTSSEIIASVSKVNNNTVIEISGLDAGDFILKDSAGVEQIITGVIESPVTAGLYTITGTAFVSGSIELSVPTSAGVYVTDIPTQINI